MLGADLGGQGSRLVSSLVEIVCTSLDDVCSAEEGGADRIELVSAIELGGLTPTAGTMAAVAKHCRLPVMSMIRPRTGGFLYSAAEFQSMLGDIEILGELGSEGFVFGILDENRTVDKGRCSRLVSACGTKQSVFHRAFDIVADPFAAIEALIDCGFTRILTSGQAATAHLGAECIARLVVSARGRIEILPASGIRSENVKALKKLTGATQFHLSAFDSLADCSMTGTNFIFNGKPAQEKSYLRTRTSIVRAVVDALNE